MSVRRRGDRRDVPAAVRVEGKGSASTMERPCGGTSGTGGHHHRPQKSVTDAPTARDQRASAESEVSDWWKKSLPPKTYTGVSRAPVSSASRTSPRRFDHMIACVPGAAEKISAMPPGRMYRLWPTGGRAKTRPVIPALSVL